VRRTHGGDAGLHGGERSGPADLLEDTVRLCLEAGVTRDELLAASGLHGTGTVAAVLARWDREALRLAVHLSDDPCPLEGGAVE
jgi:hypothetical protein